MGFVPLKENVAPGSTLDTLETASRTLPGLASLITMSKQKEPLSQTWIAFDPSTVAVPLGLVIVPVEASGGTLLHG